MDIKFTLTDEEVKAIVDDFGPDTSLIPQNIPIEDRIIELIFHMVVRPIVEKQKVVVQSDRVEKLTKATKEDLIAIDAILNKGTI